MKDIIGSNLDKFKSILSKQQKRIYYCMLGVYNTQKKF